jgi:hypothetical protein
LILNTIMTTARFQNGRSEQPKQTCTILQQGRYNMSGERIA